MAVQKPVVVVGSINTDLVSTSRVIPPIGATVIGTGFQVHPGGKGANQAVAVARLGHPVKMIGRVGRDSFGPGQVQYLRSAGVDCTGVAETEGSSGVAVILVSERGENCIVVSPGANAKVTPEDIDANLHLIREAGIVLAQLEIPIPTVAHLAEVCWRLGVPLMLDPAPAAALPESLLRCTTWLTPNESEADFLINLLDGETPRAEPSECADALLSTGCDGVVLKLGDRGAFLASPRIPGEAISAFPVNAVDTTGAGDAFNGAFATALMQGRSPVESATFAAAAAAISVTRPGAQPSMATLEEVKDFLDRNLLAEPQVSSITASEP
ncbi:MAG TPA: ribokinase [Acidobacteriaceae bacterium]